MNLVGADWIAIGLLVVFVALLMWRVIVLEERLRKLYEAIEEARCREAQDWRKGPDA